MFANKRWKSVPAAAQMLELKVATISSIFTRVFLPVEKFGPNVVETPKAGDYRVTRVRPGGSNSNQKVSQ